MASRATFSFSPTDLRLLRIFQAVVRHKGFAAAQDELGLNPGTISNHISHLETRFGVRLCERGRKGFSMTPDGVRILEAAENLLRSVENFTGIVGSVRAEGCAACRDRIPSGSLAALARWPLWRDLDADRGGAFIDKGAALVP